jgi:hypothetical protein
MNPLFAELMPGGTERRVVPSVHVGERRGARRASAHRLWIWSGGRKNSGRGVEGLGRCVPVVNGRGGRTRASGVGPVSDGFSVSGAAPDPTRGAPRKKLVELQGELCRPGARARVHIIIPLEQCAQYCAAVALARRRRKLAVDATRSPPTPLAPPVSVEKPAARRLDAGPVRPSGRRARVRSVEEVLADQDLERKNRAS